MAGDPLRSITPSKQRGFTARSQGMELELDTPEVEEGLRRLSQSDDPIGGTLENPMRRSRQGRRSGEGRTPRTSAGSKRRGSAGRGQTPRASADRRGSGNSRRRSGSGGRNTSRGSRRQGRSQSAPKQRGVSPGNDDGPLWGGDTLHKARRSQSRRLPTTSNAPPAPGAAPKDLPPRYSSVVVVLSILSTAGVPQVVRTSSTATIATVKQQVAPEPASSYALVHNSVVLQDDLTLYEAGIESGEELVLRPRLS